MTQATPPAGGEPPQGDTREPAPRGCAIWWWILLLLAAGAVIWIIAAFSQSNSRRGGPPPAAPTTGAAMRPLPARSSPAVHWM
jgi:hypothetical protein